MRVLHANFAGIGSTPGEAGGIAGYMQTLAREQRDLGHVVGALSSGSTYLGSATDSIASPRLRQLTSWEGIDRLEVVNSPFLAPALWNFAEASNEAESPELEAVMREVVRVWKPDVVHIHTLEGLSASCVGAFREAGARVVMSLHNHHPFCPQVYLMHGRRTPCLDYLGGRRCAECERPIDVDREKSRRAGVIAAEPPSIAPPPLPPILRFEESGTPTAATARLIEQGHEWWESLENLPPDGASASRVDHSFGARRRAMVRAIHNCDRVLAVSDFVGSLAGAMGVESARIQVQRIAGVHRTRLTPRDRSDGVLRLAFLGFNNYYKGLHMLVDAIAMLPAEFRSRMHLAAFGPGCPGIRERAEAIRPRLAGLELGGAYAPADLPKLLAGRDIGIVPSVWWDNGPQTLIEMLNAGLPVLGARLGGIPDLIEHGVNGLLFRGNDRLGASSQLERLITEPDLVGKLWSGVRPGATPKEHACEVVDVYARTLKSDPTPALGQGPDRRS